MELNKQYKNKLRKKLEVKFEGNKDEIINHLIDMYLEESRIRISLEEKLHNPIKTKIYSFERFKRAVEKYKRIISKKSKRDFLLSVPHHSERGYRQEYLGTMISADYGVSVPGALTIRARLNNGDTIAKVLSVCDFNIQKVEEFVNKLNDLEKRDEDYFVILYKHSEHIWRIELMWYRNTSGGIKDISIYLSLDQDYDRTKKEDKKILNQKYEEYLDKYIKDVKEHFDILPVDQKDIDKFVYRYFIITAVIDGEQVVPKPWPRKQLN